MGAKCSPISLDADCTYLLCDSYMYKEWICAHVIFRPQYQTRLSGILHVHVRLVCVCACVLCVCFHTPTFAVVVNKSNLGVDVATGSKSNLAQVSVICQCIH